MQRQIFPSKFCIISTPRHSKRSEESLYFSSICANIYPETFAMLDARVAAQAHRGMKRQSPT